MNKIVTITLNPAIDKSAAVAEMIPEKKLTCTHDKYEPGGGGINVARAIKKLGGNSLALYLSGGHNGKFLSDLIVKENISILNINTRHETRENFILFDEKKSLQYRFGFPGPTIFESEWKLLLQKLSSLNDIDFIVASGSVPNGIPDDIFCSIAKIANERKAKFILDTSGMPLVNSLTEKIFLIKPNLSELASIAGTSDIKTENIYKICASIIKNKNIEVIVVSLGAEGAMTITKNEAFTLTPPKTTVLSTVGAGDSMVGGIVWKLTNGSTLQEAIQYGVACGTAATMHPGTELCNKETADHIFEKINVQSLL